MSTDYSHITKFDFTKDVIDVAYSPDGEYIAVSLTATEIDFDSVVLVNTSTMSIVRVKDSVATICLQTLHGHMIPQIRSC